MEEQDTTTPESTGTDTGDGGSGEAYGGDGGGAGGGDAQTAEITPTQIWVYPPDSITSSDQIILGAECRNDGRAATGSFKAKYSLSTGEIQEYDWPNMNHNETHWQEWQHAPMDAGSYTFTVEFDPDGEVQEGNKSDNSLSTSFSVQAAAATDAKGGRQQRGNAQAPSGEEQPETPAATAQDQGQQAKPGGR